MRKIFTVVLLFAAMFAQAEGLKIKVTIKSSPGKNLMLAFYYTDKIYVKDTIQLDKNGTGVFQFDSLLHQGLYKIYLDEKSHFDFLLGADQQFTLTNEAYDPREAKVEGSAETKGFFDYYRKLTGAQEKSKLLNDSIINLPVDKRENIRKELAKLNDDLLTYCKNESVKYKDSFLSKLLLMNATPQLDRNTLPEDIRKSDSLFAIASYYYQKAHYWDNFDYTDDRFLYSPIFKSKLEGWFKNVLVQEYDSLKAPVIEFIEKCQPSKNVYQYVLPWFLNSTVTSSVMGMDALFIDIAKRFYLTGEAPWTTKEAMEKIKENIMFTEHNLIGEYAPSIIMNDINGNSVNLYAIPAKVTVVIIYEPDCSHCKEFMPKFHDEVYSKYKNKGLEVFAIYGLNKKPDWEKFVNEHQMNDWINVWDPNHVTRFKILLDGRTTPAIYVLDKNKKIIAKKLGSEQLDRFIDYQLK